MGILQPAGSIDMPDISNQILEQVNQAVAKKTPLRIAGNDSKAFMGRSTEGSLLSVSGHSGVVEYEPTELVITVRAGTTVTELNAELDRHSQFLGCESPESGNATVGGSLACNQSGPGRPWIGSIRDHVLGVRLINGKGEHLRFGGRVMKNVAGYDVSRLQAGAMGCLGVITEVTLRVYPHPQHQQTVTASMTATDAVEQMNRESLRGGPLSAACWVDGLMYLRFSGNEAAVRSRSQACSGKVFDADDDFWAQIREQQHDFFAGDEPLWRLSVKPAAEQSDEPCLLDWGGAQRWLRGGHVLDARQSLAEQQGGQATLFRGGDREAEVFHARTEVQKRVHLALKKAFDPHGIFNPGRLYGWL